VNESLEHNVSQWQNLRHLCEPVGRSRRPAGSSEF